MTVTDIERAALPVAELVATASDLVRAGRWQRAEGLLDAANTVDARAHAVLAVAAAEVAVERDWSAGTDLASGRLATAEERCVAVDPGADARWDLDFVRLRHAYAALVLGNDGFQPGPWGKDPDAMTALRRQAEDLCTSAPDEGRRGWGRMYLGLVLDNVCGERDAAPTHYEAALRAGESGDDLLAREALRHLGDHDHDAGDHDRARYRWDRATTLGAGAGAVVGTLSQQLLLAVLSRDAGEEEGAVALAHEVARWAGALGATALATQARSFLAGVDPTAAPPEAAG